MSILIRPVRQISAAILLSLFSAASTAETSTDSVKSNLDEIRAPEIPAFAALGVSPTEVLAPTSPKAFALAILNDGVRDDGSIASDFAVQFSPYWWQPRDMTWDEYNDETDTFDIMKQSLGFSIATSSVEVELPPATPGAVSETRNDTLVSFGMSVDLVRGKPSSALRSAKKRIVQASTETAEAIGRLQNRIAADPRFVEDLPEVTNFNWDTECVASEEDYCVEYLEKVKEIERAYAQSVAAQVDAMSNERVGHSLQFASAVVYQLIDGSTDSRERALESYWLSYKYVRETENGASPFKFVALARYNNGGLPGMDMPGDSFDLGGRLIWESKAYPVNASIEYIRRELDGDSDERLAALVDYRINENCTAFLSIGQNLESNVVPLLTDDDAIATIGLRINTNIAKGRL